jgi:hypothetical protein
MRRFGAALVVAMLLFAGACGGDDEKPSSGDKGGKDQVTATPSKDRPTVTAVSRALTEGKNSLLGPVADQIDDETARCIAQALVDSDLTDQALKALVAGDKSYKPSPEDEKALDPVSTQMVQCIQSSVPTDAPTG